jgi:hypothetical protein
MISNAGKTNSKTLSTVKLETKIVGKMSSLLFLATLMIQSVGNHSFPTYLVT